ncbi:MAG: hypothetical protein LBK53_01855 [Heliobacteriaceae bacterium]|jgi:hypothetical protein|nr:hypothetical protein [Heliobacteriaceae bacterium]
MTLKTNKVTLGKIKPYFDSYNQKIGCRPITLKQLRTKGCVEFNLLPETGDTCAKFSDKSGTKWKMLFDKNEFLLATEKWFKNTKDNILATIIKTEKGMQRQDLIKSEIGAFKYVTVIKNAQGKSALCSNSGVPTNDFLIGFPGHAQKKLDIASLPSVF